MDLSLLPILKQVLCSSFMLNFRKFSSQLFHLALKCFCISKWPGSLCLVHASIYKIKYSILSEIAFLFDLV